MSFSCQFSLNFTESTAHFLGWVLEARGDFEPNFCFCMLGEAFTLHFVFVSIICGHPPSLSIEKVHFIFDL